MNRFKNTAWVVVASAALALLLASCAGQDQIRTSAHYNIPEGSAGAVRNASQVLDDFVSAAGTDIPSDVLKNAAGIAVIPGLTKAAFIAGGQHGTGVLMTQGREGWSLPVFASISGASIGAQIGITTTDILLVFRESEPIQALLRNQSFRVGADFSVAAGPIGTSAEVTALAADVLAYSRTEGAFAGLSLSGGVLSLNRDQTVEYYAAANQEDVRGYYGEQGDMLLGRLLDPGGEAPVRNVPPSAAQLRERLNRLTEERM